MGKAFHYIFSCLVILISVNIPLVAYSQITLSSLREQAVIDKEHWVRPDFQKAKIDTVKVYSSHNKKDREYTIETFVYNESGQLLFYQRLFPNWEYEIANGTNHYRIRKKGKSEKNWFKYANGKLINIISKPIGISGFRINGIPYYDNRIKNHFRKYPNKNYDSLNTPNIYISSFSFTYDAKGRGDKQIVNLEFYQGNLESDYYEFLLKDTLVYSFNDPRILFYTKHPFITELGYCSEDFLKDSTQWNNLPEYSKIKQGNNVIQIREVKNNNGAINRYEFYDSKDRKRLTLARTDYHKYKSTAAILISYNENGINKITEIGLISLDFNNKQGRAIHAGSDKLSTEVNEFSSCLPGLIIIFKNVENERNSLIMYNRQTVFYNTEGFPSKIALLNYGMQVLNKEDTCVRFQPTTDERYKTFIYTKLKQN